MEQPRVTVGVLVHADPGGLWRTVPSVFGQTWTGSLRLVVVHDGSADDTPKLLESLVANYGQIDVVRIPANQGRPSARNTILDHAGDDYLAWIEAGDLWHPRKLELQFATLLDAEDHDPETPLLCTGPMRWVTASTGEHRVRVPEIDGDQLRNALTSALLAHLQGIVGRAEHFRRIGGFDERLPRRQDYDFLVRFLAAGGRVVATSDDQPLFTQLRNGVPAQPVASANAAIRAKHRPYYQQYGRRLARQVRGNQHRLVARFYAQNGERARSVSYRALAKLSSPRPVAATRAAIGRAARIRPSARGVIRPLAHVMRPVLPALRKPGVIEFARRLGVLKILDAAGVSRVVYAEVKSEIAVPVTSSEVTPTEERLGQISELEKEAAASGESPEVWFHLEDAYRQLGMLPAAESALDRGRQQFPDDRRLTVRLIELLPLRKKWADCVEAWSNRPDIDEHVRSLTYVRVARALRECGRPADALALAEEGLRRWPHELRLADDVYINRAALLDWRQAVSGSGPEVGDGKAAGVVTDLGFLAGGEGAIEGRIAPAGPEARRVSLAVNGVQVASTSAAGVAVGAARFSLNCHELLPYLGDGDVITVASGGRPLVLDGYGTACTVATGYESRFAELRGKLAAGHVFTKFGALRPGNTPKRKANTLALYDDVSAIITASHDYPTYPFMGNLLGAIREHDFIAYDVGGFDAGYVSRHQAPAAVRAEFIDVCRTLVRHGYHVVVLPWSAYVRAKRVDRIFVDLNFAWFNPAGELNFSYGWRCSPVTDRDRLHQRRDGLIGNHVVRVPGNAEEVLEQIYGSSWAVPDQAFDVDDGLRRDPAYLITRDEMAALVDEFGDNFVELQPDALSEAHADATTTTTHDLC